MATGYFATQFPVFKPAMRMILAITNSLPAHVTTTLDGTTPGNHGYLDGIVVRLDIPFRFGMQQANQLTGAIIVTGPTTFDIDIDTTLFAAFAVPALPASHLESFAQSVPVGEVNETLLAALQNVL